MGVSFHGLLVCHDVMNFNPCWSKRRRRCTSKQLAQQKEKLLSFSASGMLYLLVRICPQTDSNLIANSQDASQVFMVGLKPGAPHRTEWSQTKHNVSKKDAASLARSLYSKRWNDPTSDSVWKGPVGTWLFYFQSVDGFKVFLPIMLLFILRFTKINSVTT